MRQQLDAVAEGREIFLGQLQAGAFSFSSVLSLPDLLETLVPQLEAAADGDPATEVPDRRLSNIAWSPICRSVAAIR